MPSNFMAPDQVVRQPKVGKNLFLIDKTILAHFFNIPLLKYYSTRGKYPVQKRNYAWIWFDRRGLMSFRKRCLPK